MAIGENGSLILNFSRWINNLAVISLHLRLRKSLRSLHYVSRLAPRAILDGGARRQIRWRYAPLTSPNTLSTYLILQ